MKNTWGMSDAIASVSLMALANGAGDVITALVSGSAPGGVSYNIGALYGAGLFVAIPVMCVVCIKLGGVVYEPVIIYRDIGIYILSTIVTLLFAACGAIYWWSAVIFLLIYVMLVVMAIVIERKGWFKEEKVAKQDNIMSGVLGKALGQFMNTKPWAQAKRTFIHKQTTLAKDSINMTEAMFDLSHPDLKGKKDEFKQSLFSRFIDWAMFFADLPYVWVLKFTALPAHRAEWLEESWRFYTFPFTGVYFALWTFTGEWYSMLHLVAGLPICIVLFGFFTWKLRGGVKNLINASETAQLKGNEMSTGTNVVADVKKSPQVVLVNENDINTGLISKEVGGADQKEVEDEEDIEVAQPT